MKNIILFILTIFIFASCEDLSGPGAFSDQFVLQGYLISQRPIDSLILRRTAPIDVFYTDEAYSINNATIKIIEGNKIIELKNDPRRHGYYFNADTNYKIISNKKYEIQISVDGKQISGSTIVPETLSFTQKFPSPMIYKNGLLQLKWTRSKNYLDYIISIKSLDTTDAFLIPKDFNRPNSAEVKKPEPTNFIFNLFGKNEFNIPWFFLIITEGRWFQFLQLMKIIKII